MEQNVERRPRRLNELLGIDYEHFSAVDDIYGEEILNGSEMLSSNAKPSVRKSPADKAKSSKKAPKKLEDSEESEEISSSDELPSDEEDETSDSNDLDLTGDIEKDEDELLQFYEDYLKTKGEKGLKKKLQELRQRKSQSEKSSESLSLGEKLPGAVGDDGTLAKSPAQTSTRATQGMNAEQLAKYMKTLKEAGKDLLTKLGEGEGDLPGREYLDQNFKMKEKLLKKYVKQNQSGDSPSQPSKPRQPPKTSDVMRAAVASKHMLNRLYSSDSDSEIDGNMEELTRKMVDLGLTNFGTKPKLKSKTMSKIEDVVHQKPMVTKSSRVKDEEAHLQKRIDELKEMVAGKPRQRTADERTKNSRQKVSDWVNSEGLSRGEPSARMNAMKGSAMLKKSTTEPKKFGLKSMPPMINPSSLPPMRTKVHLKKPNDFVPTGNMDFSSFSEAKLKSKLSVGRMTPSANLMKPNAAAEGLSNAAGSSGVSKRMAVANRMMSASTNRSLSDKKIATGAPKKSPLPATKR